MPDGSEIADMVVDDLRERGLDVFKVSAASGSGLRELTFAMAGIVKAARAARPHVQAERIIIRPPSADGNDDFTVTATDVGWQVRGDKPERWVRQTDFTNDEAVGFLADRLNRLGVEKRLVAQGAQEGDAVLIGHRRRRRRLRLQAQHRGGRGDPRPSRRGPALRRGTPCGPSPS